MQCLKNSAIAFAAVDASAATIGGTVGVLSTVFTGASASTVLATAGLFAANAAIAAAIVMTGGGAIMMISAGAVYYITDMHQRRDRSNEQPASAAGYRAVEN